MFETDSFRVSCVCGGGGCGVGGVVALCLEGLGASSLPVPLWLPCAVLVALCAARCHFFGTSLCLVGRGGGGLVFSSSLVAVLVFSWLWAAWALLSFLLSAPCSWGYGDCMWGCSWGNLGSGLCGLGTWCLSLLFCIGSGGVHGVV